MFYQNQTWDGVPTRTLGPGRWIVRFHIGLRGEQNISYKSVKTSLSQTRFKTVKL